MKKKSYAGSVLNAYSKNSRWSPIFQQILVNDDGKDNLII
jgi:hypothetical protein